VLLGAAIVGLVVGRLAAMILTGTNPITHPADMILIRGGVDTGFASVGALVYLAFALRRGGWRAADAIAPAALAGLAGWHGGCLFRGTCLGTRSELPWALSEPGSDLTRHPTELYAALLFLGVALVALTLLPRSLPRSAVFFLGLASAGLIRLVTEPIRPSLGSGPIWWYSTAALLGVILLGVAFLRSYRDGQRHSEPNRQ
ncbi:MAG: prolipoprotein diacylglyceryl transferase family protein, partial [Acidimicrobiia bacterium]